MFKEDAKKKQQQVSAQQDQDTYDRLNFHDDQFDLSDASLSIALSLLAITSLTGKRWLFVVATLPITFGVVMGLAGAMNWQIHPNMLTQLLSARSIDYLAFNYSARQNKII